MRPYDVFFVIKTMGPGSQRYISECIGKSEAYVSVMQYIARNASRKLLDAWHRESIPFDLVREIVKEDKPMQARLVRVYLNATKGGGKKARGKARAELLHALGVEAG
jgi:hypothetical protein